MKRKRVLITLIPTLGEALLAKLQVIIERLRSDGYDVRLLTLYEQSEVLDPLLLRLPESPRRTTPSEWLRFWIDLRWLLWTQRMRVWAKVGAWAAFGKVMKDFRRSRDILATLDPDLVYIWNPYCCAFGILGECARQDGREVRTIEYGVLPATLLLDEGFIFDSRLFADYAAVRGRYVNAGEAVVRQLKEAGEAHLYKQASATVPPGAELRHGDIGIIVLGLSEVDAGVVPAWGEERRGAYPYHTSGVEMARAIGAASSTYKVIYKPHPNHNPMRRDVQLGRNVWVVNGDARSLLDWCHVVVANGSKMEIDAMLMEKPVINIGKGILSYAGASYQMNAWEGLDETIRQAHAREGFEQRRAALADFLGYLSVNLV